MTNWHVFLWFTLVGILCFYVVLLFATRVPDHSPFSLSLSQQEEFNRSIKRSAKVYHKWQCWLMVVSAVIFSVFGARFFDYVAMFCVCMAVFHFVRGRQIIIN